VYERVGANTTLVSIGPTGGNGAFDAQFGGVSADGTRVYVAANQSRNVTVARGDGSAVLGTITVEGMPPCGPYTSWIYGCPCGKTAGSLKGL